MCFYENTYFDGDTCGETVFSITSQPSNNLECDGSCSTLAWYENDTANINRCWYLNVAATSDDVGEYTVTRTKGLLSEDMKVYICEISGIDSTRDNVIANVVDLDDIYIDE